MKFYYIPFHPSAKIDYLDLLAFYEMADYTPERQAYDTIHYQAVSALAKDLCLTEYAVKKVLNSKEYSPFLIVDKEKKVITLQNSFPKGCKR